MEGRWVCANPGGDAFLGEGRGLAGGLAVWRWLSMGPLLRGRRQAGAGALGGDAGDAEAVGEVVLA